MTRDPRGVPRDPDRSAPSRVTPHGSRVGGWFTPLSPAELFSPARNPFLLQGVRLQVRRWAGVTLLAAGASTLFTLLLLGWWYELRSRLPLSSPAAAQLGWAPPGLTVDFLWLLNLVPLGAWASGLGNMLVYREYVQESLPLLRTCPWTPLEWTLKRSVFPVLFLAVLALAALPAYLALAAVGSVAPAAAFRLTAMGAAWGIAVYVLFLTQSPWVSDAMRRPWLQQGAAARPGRWRRQAAAAATDPTARPREAEYGATPGWGIGWVVFFGVAALTVLPPAMRGVIRGFNPRASLLDAALRAAAGPVPFFAGEISGALLFGTLGSLAAMASFALAVQVADPDRLHRGTRAFSVLVGALGWAAGAGLVWSRLGLQGTLVLGGFLALVVASPTLFLRWLRRGQPERKARAVSRPGAARRGAGAWGERLLRNPVARFDLLYRQRGYSLTFLFLCGVLGPGLIAWSEGQRGSFRSLPFAAAVLWVSLPALGVALLVPLLGIRLWAADWERRTVAPLLVTPLGDEEILKGRRSAAWVLGMLPVLGIASAAAAAAVGVGIGDGRWSPLVIVGSLACWALSAGWLQSTAAVDPLPARPGARFWTAIPMVAVFLGPFVEYAVLGGTILRGGFLRPPGPVMAQAAAHAWIAAGVLALGNLALAGLVFAWNVRRLRWLRRSGLDAR